MWYCINSSSLNGTRLNSSRSDSLLVSRGIYTLTYSEKLDVSRGFCCSSFMVRPTAKDLTSLLVSDHVKVLLGKEVNWNRKVKKCVEPLREKVAATFKEQSPSAAIKRQSPSGFSCSTHKMI